MLLHATSGWQRESEAVPPSPPPPKQMMQYTCNGCMRKFPPSLLHLEGKINDSRFM